MAWVRDGQIEALADGRAFNSALTDLAELVESTDEGSSVRAMLEVQAGRSTARQSLIDSASLPLDEALEILASAEAGDGWSTDGSHGPQSIRFRRL